MSGVKFYNNGCQKSMWICPSCGLDWAYWPAAGFRRLEGEGRASCITCRAYREPNGVRTNGEEGFLKQGGVDTVLRTSVYDGSVLIQVYDASGTVYWDIHAPGQPRTEVRGKGFRIAGRGRRWKSAADVPPNELCVHLASARLMSGLSKNLASSAYRRKLSSMSTSSSGGTKP